METSFEALRAQAREYYDGKLRAHGVTAQGVDWKNAESQELRFRQLARVLEEDRDASVLDYGCGYAALAVYLRGAGHRGPYRGFDVSAGMIDAGAKVTASLADCQLTADRATLDQADYTIASGIFNVRMDAPDATWRDYLVNSLADIAALSRRGFSFNALTSYSDPDKRRADLYYADPLDLFDHCQRTFSRRVSLLHDYPLYEFTLLVRL